MVSHRAGRKLPGETLSSSKNFLVRKMKQQTLFFVNLSAASELPRMTKFLTFSTSVHMFSNDFTLSEIMHGFHAKQVLMFYHLKALCKYCTYIKHC